MVVAMNNRLVGWRIALLAAAVAVFTGCSAAVGSEGDAGGDAAPDAQAVCHFTDGRTCQLGMSCPAGDGCNHCVCQANGSLTCTELACADAGPPVDAGTCSGPGGPCMTQADCCVGVCRMASGATSGVCTAMPTPTTRFSCGPNLLCDSLTQFCERSVSDVGGVPDNYACIAFPDQCRTAHNCGCLAEAGVACAVPCSTSGIGIEVTCPGG
jgi:hypothetical protein